MSQNSIMLSVVLPAYQEEENLRLLLPRILFSLSALPVTFEVIVIDTQVPMDATLDVCQLNNVAYVSRQGGNSYGDAVRTGIATARGEYIIFMDADGSHPPEFIPKLFEQRSHSSVVIASRYVERGFTENSWMLIFMSRVLNWTYSIVLGIHCKDVSNSYRLYSGGALKPLELRCSNFDIVEEILYKIVRRRSDIALIEVPFTFKKRMFGKTKRSLISFILTYIYTLIKLRFFV